MATVGSTLKTQRQKRGLSLKDVARATKIGPHLLEALEKNDLARLPGGPFNKGFVRGYARFIGLDPEALVDAYSREEKAQGISTPDAHRGDHTEKTPLFQFRLEDHEQVLVLKWRPARNILLALGALLVLVPAAWVLLAGDSGPTGATALPAAEAARRPQPAASPPPAAASGPRHRQDAGQGNPRAGIAGTSPSPSPVHAGAAARTASPAPSFAPPKSGLRVMESGVGTGVVHRRLVGQRHRFREGGKVWFWTRSVGGHAGELLRHVWIRDGHEVISYDLKVGGPHWRNASLKTLKPGSAGSWTVEARAADGRVLSRRQFVCVPPKKRDTASRAAIR